MQLTLRQRQRLKLFGTLWLLLTVLCAVAGPFGTHDVMGLPARFGYWALVVAGSILGSVLASHVQPDQIMGRIALWCGYAVALTAGVFGLNAVLFPPSQGISDVLYLLAIVCVCVAAINGVIYLVHKPDHGAEGADTIDTQARFLRRLPLEQRAPLIRIEAQDHYLNVVTTKGSAMILLRLAEAVDELDGAGGLQTHRSHWVKLDSVQGHRRKDGRDTLVMSDGSTVPVARTRRDAARAAGLF